MSEEEDDRAASSAPTAAAKELVEAAKKERGEQLAELVKQKLEEKKLEEKKLEEEKLEEEKKLEQEKPETAEPDAEPEPDPSPFAPALAQLTRAPVTVLDTVDTPDGTFVAYRFNTLAAHLGKLSSKARARAEARIERFEASCTADREQALASLPEADRDSYNDQLPPCDVRAAWSLIKRPPPDCGKHSCTEAPDDMSPRCDALGVALMRSPGSVRARRILTEESCLDRLEPLRREHVTGQGRAEILVTATHEEWDSAHYWGWSVNTSRRRLLAFKLDRGRLEQVLELELDEYIFLEDTLRASTRYKLERPGVITRYCEAWNSIHDGVQITQERWDEARRGWGEAQIIEEELGTIPDDALPLDRWGAER
ncbi:MAG: hypothetical protein H6713_27120 [Myxococcales bacterium]|nr:hypothetical protein [Myxococcales bacterium]